MVSEATANTGRLLDQHLMACFAEGFHSRRGDRYTVRVIFDLFGYTDNHACSSSKFDKNPLHVNRKKGSQLSLSLHSQGDSGSTRLPAYHQN
ncbi:hypothetical protein D3C74_412160 [compost metagenome]